MGTTAFAIRHEDSDSYIGHAHRHGEKWHIELEPEDEEFAAVASIGEIIPTFVAYYDKHPPQWEGWTESRLAPAFDVTEFCCTKLTQFGLLCVDRDEKGQWLAYRGNYPLMRHDEPATFTTLKEAQCAADAFMSLGYPNSKTIEDGFEWETDPEIALFFAEQDRPSSAVQLALHVHC